MGRSITDISMSIGGRDSRGKLTGMPELLREMELYHISHAAVWHEVALMDPASGNRLMKEEAARTDGRAGVCAILDPALDEECLPGEGSLTERLRAFAPECVRILPEFARTVFHPVYWRAILEAADALRLPLIIDEEYTPEFFARLPEISAAYPGIRFVLLRCGLWRGRYVFGLLRECPNVYFTTDTMLDYGQIEEITEKGGSGRLLFASRYPEMSPSGALGLALYADIPEKERDGILSGNWEAIRYGADRSGREDMPCGEPEGRACADRKEDRP